jgi:uncharacterized protein YlxW (UPF0749 family)
LEGSFLKNNIKAQIAIGLICILLGFIITIQFKSVRKNFASENQQFQRADELQAELTKERKKNEDLYKNLLQYEKDLNALQQAVSQNSGYAAELIEQLKRAQVLAGLIDLEGEGVIVTLNDSKLKNDNRLNLSEDYFIIHDEDILAVLNELRDAGAEALSINDERIISTSEIRCAGTTVSVNNNRYSPPFEIKAIGNPSTLVAGLNLRGGVVEILRQWGIEITVRESSKIFIPRYTGYINFKYAVPVDKGGENTQ